MEPSWNLPPALGVDLVMIRSVLALALGVVLLAFACTDERDAARPHSPPAELPPGAPRCGAALNTARAHPAAPASARAHALLAVRSKLVGSELFWADGLTLEPLDGRSLELPYSVSATGRSPDGRTLAVGADARGLVELVDLERMSSLGTIDIGAGGFIERLHWVSPRLLLASVSGRRTRVVAVDPRTRRVVTTRKLGGTLISSHPAGDQLVFLLAPADHIGVARVATFDGRRVRVAELREIRAGWEQEGETQEDFRVRQSSPGLAVEPGGRRALVVPGGDRVAEIDLQTMRVDYHDLSEPVSLLRRLLDWLEPDAEAKAMDGPARNAVWLPSGLVAVSGGDYSGDEQEVDVTPAGLALIDPCDWSVRRLSDEPTQVAFRNGALLASAWKQGSNEQKLIAFEEDGTVRFSLARRATDLSQLDGRGRLLYAPGFNGTRYEIVDLATGKTVARPKTKPYTWLVQAG